MNTEKTYTSYKQVLDECLPNYSNQRCSAKQTVGGKVLSPEERHALSKEKEATKKIFDGMKADWEQSKTRKQPLLKKVGGVFGTFLNSKEVS